MIAFLLKPLEARNTTQAMQWHRQHTDTTMDMATYRLNRPRCRSSEKKDNTTMTTKSRSAFCNLAMFSSLYSLLIAGRPFDTPGDGDLLHRLGETVSSYRQDSLHLYRQDSRHLYSRHHSRHLYHLEVLRSYTPAADCAHPTEAVPDEPAEG